MKLKKLWIILLALCLVGCSSQQEETGSIRETSLPTEAVEAQTTTETTEAPTVPSAQTEPPATEPAPSGVMGTVTGDYLRIRAGAGTSHEVLDFLMIGDRVEILEQKTVNGMTWGRTEDGWISLDYVDLDRQESNEPSESWMARVIADCLRIRSGAGLDHEIVGFLYYGAKVEIFEEATVEGMTWGRTEDGWISLDYVD
jgi:uncharacterized protein YgiM (DUF1202 family)